MAWRAEGRGQIRNAGKDNKKVEVDELPGKMAFQPYLRPGVPLLEGTNCRHVGVRVCVCMSVHVYTHTHLPLNMT